MEHLSLSVFFPCYNEEANVERTTLAALDACRKITDDFEVIIVDDGSRDRTGEIADRLATEHPEVRVVHNRPNQGYGGALQAGFRAALLGVLALVAAVPASAASAQFDQGQKDEIGAIVKDYLMAHPEVIRDAMQELDRLNPRPGTASNSMALFLAINTSSVTLLPTAVIALRAAAGSADPAGILPTTLFASICGTIAAVIAAMSLARFFPAGAPDPGARLLDRGGADRVRRRDLQAARRPLSAPLARLTRSASRR